MFMRKILPLAIIIILVAFCSWFYWKYYFTYSDGNRTGLLQKFSRRGNMFKTYEGELVLSSLIGNTTSPLSSEKFYFSVNDPAVAKKLMNYEGQRVALHYQEKNGTLFWRGDTRYIVDSIRPIGP
jgi:hypothetical protein